MSSTLTPLVAAQLSAAAYSPSGPSTYPIAGDTSWTELTQGYGGTAKAPDTTTEFVVYINQNTKQIVFAFRGSTLDQYGSNFQSDLGNAGAAAWESIKANATAALKSIQNNPTYAGYAIITDGHSLGGGMAQTMALENNLSGYGQNSLPVSTGAVTADNITYTQWQNWAKTNSFSETNLAGDPATIYYTGLGSAFSGGAFYLNGSATTTTIVNPYVKSELLGIAISLAVPVLGAEITGWSIYQSHSIATVVSLLSAGSVSTPQISLTAAQTATAITDASTISSVTVNPNGSSTITETNGTTYNVATAANATPPTSLASLASGETYIFDPGTTNVAYVITGIAGVNASAIAYDPNTSGTLTFTQDATPGLKLSDGTVLNVPGGGDMQLTASTGGTAAPEQTLIDYLALIGDPLTAAQLDADNYNSQNPTALANMNRIDSGPIANGDEEILYDYVGGAGNASPSIAGATTVTERNAQGQNVQVTAFNVVEVQGIDFAHATLTNIQELEFYGPGTATLTQTQFNQPGLTIAGSSPSDVIRAATSGTFNLNNDPNSDMSLTASDWGGTTLIGNNQNGEVLTASLFGNDTLTAGNGTGDQLVTGEGVDKLTGGTGSDTFIVNNSLAAGSVITGKGSGNTLQAAAGVDISGATVTGIQTLSYSGSITVSFAELSEFSSIVGSGTITVADDGTVAAGSTLKVAGVVTIPALSISGGGIAVLQGGTLNAGPVTVNSGALMIGYGTLSGADTINGTLVSSGGTLNITGNVSGSGTLTVGSGAINSSGSSVSIGSVSVNAGGIWTLSGADSTANLTDNGTIAVTSGGSLDVSAAIDPSSSGTFQLMMKGTLEISAILGTGTKIQFLGSSPANDLIIDRASSFGTQVGTASYAGPLLENFTAGDVIDLKGIANTNLNLAYNSATGDLQITGSSGNALATLAFQNSTLGAGTFHTASDSSGGTLVTHS